MKRLYNRFYLKSIGTLGLRTTLVCIAVLLLGGATGLFAQSPIRGVVTDAAGQGLPGVSVKVKNSTLGISTDLQGQYTITAASSDVLVFTSIGFLTQEVTVGNQSTINVKLAEDAKSLNEVVVIGYGTQKKVSLTGAVAQISGEELQRRPVNSIQQALQGQLPGLTILDKGGSPGNSNTNIRVRGITTLSSLNEPLVMVDGIEQAFANINPDDIASISVLKDASSTAIYGSRAANGVILITTKRATGGKVTVDYNGFYASQESVSMPEHMGIEDYMRLQNVAFQNVGSAPKYTEAQIQEYVNATDRTKFPLPFTWYETMLKPAPQINHSLAVSGGNENFKARLSLRYQDQDGIIANTNSKLNDLRVNTDFKVSSKINLSTDVNYRYSKDLQPQNITEIFRLFMQNSISTVPKYPDGSYGAGPQGNNPLLLAEAGGTFLSASDYILGNIKGDWEILKGLKFTTQLGARINGSNGKDYTASYEIRDHDNPTIVRKSRPINSLTETRNNVREITLNSFLNYDKNFGDHALNALAGYSQIENNRSALSAFRQNFYNNDIQSIGQGTNDATKDNSGGESNWGLRSYFGRLNYAYKGKYLLEANSRYDGSSRFKGDNRYSFFPSFSAGWRVSEEKFWGGLSNYINEFKVRGSWGKTGNQAVDLYSYFSTLNLLTYSFSGAPVQAYTQLRMANEDLTWETTTQSNAGIDLQLLNNRFSLTVDYYKKTTADILLVLPVPGSLGLQASAQNAGTVENKGWEFSAGARNKIGEFGINANLNFNINTNNVIDLAGTGPYITGDDIDPRYITAEGYPINSYWGYKTAGLFQTQQEVDAYPVFMRAAKPGDVKVLDLNNDGKINADDMTYLGNSFPKYTFGSNLDFSYKGFGLNVLLQGASDVGIRLARALAEQGNYEGFTPSIYTNNYWTPQRTNARFARPTKQDLRNQASTDRMITDASYLRFKNIQVSYQIPSSISQKIRAQRASVYVSGTNLITFSKLNEWNLDPESLSGWQNYYPQTALYTVGFNIQF